MNKDSLHFYQFIRDFLTVYLPLQKASSPNTIKAYRDTINLFLDYLKSEQKVSLLAVTFKSITRKNIEDFLSWLETEKKYSISSRNQRLSGLKSFYKYASGKDKTLMAYYQDILDIPKKNSRKDMKSNSLAKQLYKAFWQNLIFKREMDTVILCF